MILPEREHGIVKDVTEFVKELLNEYYPSLGECVAVDPIKEGDTNNSFMARIRSEEGLQDWYVRQYCEAEQEREIIYEHAFELYYNERVNGEIQTMAPVVNTTGKTGCTRNLTESRTIMRYSREFTAESRIPGNTMT